MTQSALLVLDVQNYFFQESSRAYLKAGPGILANINGLADQAVQQGWLVVSTSHHAPARNGNLMPEKWRHLPRDEDCSLYHGLRVPENARHIAKEHYSAFFATNLEGILRDHGVGSVVICGVMTHLCVDTTVRHAFMLGLRPVVVADACCSKNILYHRAALLALGHRFAEITTTERLCAK